VVFWDVIYFCTVPLLWCNFYCIRLVCRSWMLQHVA